MKLKKIKATINECSIDCDLTEGINFVFYENETQKNCYIKAFQLLFDEAYYADDFYQKNRVKVTFEMSDNEIDYTLKYSTIKDEFLFQELEIEGKKAPFFHEMTENLINGYLKKNGIFRFFDVDDIITFTPDYVLTRKKDKLSDLENLSTLFEYLKNISPVFINKQKDCKLMLLRNGNYYLEGEREDDDEQFVLAEYFKFAINAKVADVIEDLDSCSCAYPLFVSGLFETAGDSADTEQIIGMLRGYLGQTIFLCPESMREELGKENVTGLIEKIKSEIELPF